MATLETSPEANSDRRTGRQAGGQKEKATYRGSSYRSAQKLTELTRFFFCKRLTPSHPKGEGLPYSQGRALFTSIVEMGVTILHLHPPPLPTTTTHHPPPLPTTTTHHHPPTTCSDTQGCILFNWSREILNKPDQPILVGLIHSKGEDRQTE